MMSVALEHTHNKNSEPSVIKIDGTSEVNYAVSDCAECSSCNVIGNDTGSDDPDDTNTEVL